MTNRPLTVLLIEDNPGDARLIAEFLADAGSFHITLETQGRLTSALERLGRGGVDLVLLDLSLPDSQGLATFASLHRRAPEVPVIVLTGLGDEALALRMVHDGAQDFLMKGRLDGALLSRAIRYGVERHAIRGELLASQAALARMNADLERRVEERTRELTVINAELEAFTYSVSHDLRAPLRQMDGFSRILADETGGRLGERAEHCVRRIGDATRKMGRLVDDLLGLARVGRQEIHLRTVPLGPLVEQVVSDVSPEASGRVVEWRIGALPEVACDAGLIGIAFTNLLSNALKYTRSRSPAIIEVASAEDAILVRDNGVGFDMKYADRLFGVFQRLHRAEEFEGTGVGLATVQRIVHKHGGEIWADAAPDRGATFFLTLEPRRTAGVPTR